MPGVPRPRWAGALEHSRSGRLRRHKSGPLSGLRAHGGRAGNAHRVPARQHRRRARAGIRPGGVMSSPEQMVNVRYMVDDVQAAIGFYTGHLGFTLRSSAAPAFADVTRGNLRLLLAGPASPAGPPRAPGAPPRPRGRADARWRQARPGGVDPAPPDGAGHGQGGGPAARGGGQLPQRDRHRPGREADPDRGPGRERGRAFRAGVQLPRRPVTPAAPEDDDSPSPGAGAGHAAAPPGHPRARRPHPPQGTPGSAQRRPAAAPVSLATIVREWGRIGCIGFGGPPAHIRLLRDLCVERRKWLDAQEFEDAIAACNLLPGPASTQLAIFCAWRLRGWAGALASGIAFIAPGLVVISALAAL